MKTLKIMTVMLAIASLCLTTFAARTVTFELICTNGYPIVVGTNYQAQANKKIDFTTFLLPSDYGECTQVTVSARSNGISYNFLQVWDGTTFRMLDGDGTRITVTNNVYTSTTISATNETAGTGASGFTITPGFAANPDDGKTYRAFKMRLSQSNTFTTCHVFPGITCTVSAVYLDKD